MKDEGRRTTTTVDLSAVQHVILAVLLYPELVLATLKPTMKTAERREILSLKNQLLKFAEQEQVVSEDEVYNMKQDDSFFEQMIKVFPDTVIEFIQKNHTEILKLISRYSVTDQSGVYSLHQLQNDLVQNPDFLKKEDVGSLIAYFINEYPNLEQKTDEKGMRRAEDTNEKVLAAERAGQDEDSWTDSLGDLEDYIEYDSMSDSDTINLDDQSPPLNKSSDRVLPTGEDINHEDNDNSSTSTSIEDSFIYLDEVTRVSQNDLQASLDRFNGLYQRLKRCEDKALERLEYHQKRPEKYAEWKLRLQNIRSSLKDLLKNYSDLKTHQFYSIDLQGLSQTLTKDYEPPCKFNHSDQLRTDRTISNEFTETILSPEPIDLEERKTMLVSYIQELHALKSHIESKIPDSIKGKNQADTRILVLAFKDILSKIQNAEDYQRYLMDDAQVSIYREKLNEIIKEFDAREQYIQDIINKMGTIDDLDFHETVVTQQVEPTAPEDISQESREHSSNLEHPLVAQSILDNPVVEEREPEPLFSDDSTAKVNPAAVSDNRVRPEEMESEKAMFNDLYQRLNRCEKKAQEKTEQFIMSAKKREEWKKRLDYIKKVRNELVVDYQLLLENRIYHTDMQNFQFIMKNYIEGPCKFKNNSEYKSEISIDSEVIERMQDTHSFAQMPDLEGHQSAFTLEPLYEQYRAPGTARAPERLGFFPEQNALQNPFYEKVIVIGQEIGLVNSTTHRENGITFTKTELVNTLPKEHPIHFQGTQEHWTVKGNHLSSMIDLASAIATNDPTQSTVITLKSKKSSEIDYRCITQDLLALIQLTHKGIPVDTRNLQYLYNLRFDTVNVVSSLQVASSKHPNLYPLLNPSINTAEQVTEFISKSLEAANALKPQAGKGSNLSSG